MKYSITYYLTLFVLKLKGIKKDLSEDPLNYKKMRREDVHAPSKGLFKAYKVRDFKVSHSLVTEIAQTEKVGKLLLFVHGGAFVSGPAKHHWDSIKEIMKHTGQNVWMCDYPKAPESQIGEISQNIDEVYKTALASYPAGAITLIGDSVGATLITALIQRLVQQSTELPDKIILVSPVMDATMSNTLITAIDAIDPMLSKAGILSAKKMCAGDTDLSDAIISPLNGSFEKFPKTILFLAKHDIMYPDEQLAVQKMKDANVDIEVIEGDGMPHIWPFLPVMKEAGVALKVIISKLQ